MSTAFDCIQLSLMNWTIKKSYSCSWMLPWIKYSLNSLPSNWPLAFSMLLRVLASSFLLSRRRSVSLFPKPSCIGVQEHKWTQNRGSASLSQPSNNKLTGVEWAKMSCFPPTRVPPRQSLISLPDLLVCLPSPKSWSHPCLSCTG